MAILIILTEKMIDLFHSCAKKADYRQLFDYYPEFFDVLVENLEKVKFPQFNDNIICQSIAINSIHLLNILKEWHSRGPLFCTGLVTMEKELPKFMEHFRECASMKNWNNFYNTYKSTADKIISHARNEKVIDFKIECKGTIFDSFEKREHVLDNSQKLRNEMMFQTRDELILSETKHKEDVQKLRNERSQLREKLKLSEEKREKDGRQLRNELMELFASQAQKIGNQLSKTDEKMSRTIKELEVKEKKREEKGQHLRNELMFQMKEELKLSRVKLEGDGQKLRNELMDRFESHTQQMENRISETNEKMEYLNRKLAHFNSSFNEKFNSLGEQLNSVQLDKKIEALSIQKNSGEDLNQFLVKIGDKFSEQQMEMKLRAEWIDRKMEKMMEMMKQQGEKSSGDEK